MIVVALIGLGLIFGSFVNALVWRMHEHKDWLHDRSECTHCHHKLGVLDLIPVFSWLWLRGKCRYCGYKIDDSPFTELALPALFVASYVWWPLPLEGAGLFQFILWLVFLVGFLALMVYDFKWFTLPNSMVFPLVGLAVVQVAALVIFYDKGLDVVIGALAGATIISGLFYVLFQLSNGTWIGGGDVKLALALGLLADGPLNSALLLFAASCLGTLFSVPKLLAGEGGRKMQVPFGPFLILGLIIVKLFGDAITSWYTGLVLV